MPVTIYHNPRCSKSRATLQLLKDHDLEPEVIEYLKTPPSTDQLTKILALLGIEPRALMRSGENIYKELNLKNTDLSATQLIQLMVDHPQLIERPIVISHGKAAIGRPPENVLEILPS